MGSVVSVNTGVVEAFTSNGREGETAIRKGPVEGAVTVRRDLGLEGDEVANTRNHGGSLRTVYAYAQEDVEWWGRQLGRDDLGPGSFGENLTTAGVDVTGARSGERWRVGDALLEVTLIRTPCWKLAWSLDEEHIERRFQQAARPGAYLTVVEEGEVAAGDEVRVVRTRLDHDVTMGAIALAHHVQRRLRDDLLEQADLLAAPVAAWMRSTWGVDGR